MKKIDLYLKRTPGQMFRASWFYECSTMSSETCKQAKRAFCIKHGLDDSQVKAKFAER